MRIFKSHPLLKLVNSYIIDSPQPSNLSYLWNFGSLLALCLIIQIITGVTLAMHYNPSVSEAFNSIEHIMRDVNNGWLIRYLHSNTASAFFFLVYLHIGRGLYYGSYRAPRTLVWTIGTVIFILMMATAFLGYVLPYGQMSLWGATVITNLMSAIPWVGQDIVEFLWGGFSVNNATLNRFFALHFVLPFVLAALALMHLIQLHDSAGSGNPLGVSGNYDRLPFAPYFLFKDLITIFIFMVILSVFVFFKPNVLGDSENYVMANPMQTPPAIVPEWYLLPFYAILRSIPNKLLGVIAMFSAILILLVMPYTDLSRSRGIQFRPLSKIAFYVFIGNFLILMQLGAKHVESPFIEFGQISTVIYFAHFLIIVPLVSLIENSLIDLSIKSKYLQYIILQSSFNFISKKYKFKKIYRHYPYVILYSTKAIKPYSFFDNKLCNNLTRNNTLNNGFIVLALKKTSKLAFASIYDGEKTKTFSYNINEDNLNKLAQSCFQYIFRRKYANYTVFIDSFYHYVNFLVFNLKRLDYVYNKPVLNNNKLVYLRVNSPKKDNERGYTLYFKDISDIKARPMLEIKTSNGLYTINSESYSSLSEYKAKPESSLDNNEKVFSLAAFTYNEEINLDKIANENYSILLYLTIKNIRNIIHLKFKLDILNFYSIYDLSLTIFLTHHFNIYELDKNYYTDNNYDSDFKEKITIFYEYIDMLSKNCIKNSYNEYFELESLIIKLTSFNEKDKKSFLTTINSLLLKSFIESFRDNFFKSYHYILSDKSFEQYLKGDINITKAEKKNAYKSRDTIYKLIENLRKM